MKFRRFSCALLVGLMVVSIMSLSAITVSATVYTGDEAISWLWSKEGQAIDYDGAYGAQCVDLVMAYYKYLIGWNVNGNGDDYATNTLPSGWIRTKGGQPQKGDILVYAGGSKAGHVAIYESDYITWHQNWGGQYVRRITDRHYTSYKPSDGATYWGCIHPDFSGSSITHTVDSSYGTNIAAYPKAKITAANIFDANHNQISSSSWIGTSDRCTIHEVYTDGCCKVTYPLDGGGTKTVYSKISLFRAAAPSVEYWVSSTEYGNEVKEGTAGNSYYLCYYLYDKISKKDWDEVVSSDYEIKLTIYNPDGSVKYTNENKFDYDRSWIRSFFGKAGTYKVELSAVSGYSGSSSMSFVVKENPIKVNCSTNAVSLRLGETESKTIYGGYSGYYDGNWVLNYKCSNSNVNCTWGEWTDDHRCPLTIKANAKGTTNVTISIKDKDSGSVLDSTTVTVTVDAKSYIVNYNANGGSGSPDSQTKYHNTTLTLSSTKPARTGYTFLGWSTSSAATSATYQPGGSFTGNANTTLYAVWKANPTLTMNSNNSAVISTGGEMKYFTFTPGTSGKYVIYSTSSEDTKVYLYNASGTQLDSDDDDGDGYNFRLEYSMVAGTTYTFGIKYYSSTKTGTIPFKFGNVFTVTYNANGGSGAPSVQNKDYGTGITLSSTAPTRTGYTFLGWSTSSTATDATYQPDGNFTANANTTLYAVWKQGCEAGAHSYNYWITKDPIVSAVGTLTGICSKCSGTTMVTLPKLTTTDYNYSVTKAVTCTATGTGRYTWKTTTYGSFYFDVTIPATGHSYTHEVTAPTCTERGYTIHTCACGYSYKDSATNATGHSYSYKATKAPTASATGTLTGNCTKCSDTTTMTLPKLNTADYTYSQPKAATCTATGTGRYTWKRTAYGSFYFDITIPATGHDYSDGSCTHCGVDDPDADAVKILAFGSCGENVAWTLNEDGKLTVSGSGDMTDFTKTTQPWAAYRKQILEVEVKSGVTSVGSYAFYYCKNLHTVTIPESVTDIGKYASLSADGLKNVSYGSSAAVWERIVNNTGNSRLLSAQVQFVDASVKWVAVAQEPAKTAYLQGEPLKLDGLTLEVTNKDGTVSKVTSGYRVYGYDSEALTTQTVTVLYQGLFTTFTVNVRAEGSCGAEGDNIRWTVTDGVLELTGEGRMADYTTATSPFRKQFMNNIKTVKVGEGITYLGKYAFYYLVKVGTARLPLSLQEIGNAAFYKTKTVINKYFAGTEYQWTLVKVGKNNTTLDAAQLRCETTATIVSLELTRLPDKLTYTVGEALDTTGLVAIGHYNDGSTKDLTAKVKFSGFSSTKPGTRTVTVKYGAGLATTTFRVEIVKAD